MEKQKFLLKRIACTLAFPLTVWVCCEVICRIVANTSVLDNAIDFRNLLRTFAVSYALTLAMACNLPSGRFDMSLGAQQYVIVIVAGGIAFKLGLSAAGILAFNTVFGLALGLLVGFIFSKLRILPMVYGLGMALILECIAFAVNPNGISYYGKKGVDTINSTPFILCATVLILIVISYLFNYTEYGYAKRAIEGNQMIAKDAGISIMKNCMICYMLAGGLIAVSGTFETAYRGSLTPVLNNGTVTVITSGLLTFMLGMFIAKWSNQGVGIAVASVTMRIFVIGLSKLLLSSDIQSLILYTTFVAFLIVSANSYRIKYNRVKRARIAEARVMRETLKQQAV